MHTSDMNPDNIKGNIMASAPVKSTRIRVGRSISGFGLSPGITKQQRLEVESLMKTAFGNLEEDLAGDYYPLTGMDEAVRQQLVDDHFLFVSGDKNLQAAGRSIAGFGLSPGITKEQRLEMEGLMKNAFAKLEEDLAGDYYPLTGMDEAVRQQLVD